MITEISHIYLLTDKVYQDNKFIDIFITGKEIASHFKIPYRSLIRNLNKREYKKYNLKFEIC